MKPAATQEVKEANTACPRCGRAFVCGMAAGDAACWCQDLPPATAVPLAPGATCYCADCLRELAAAPSVAR